MGNDRRKNVIYQYKESHQKKPDALKEKKELLEAITKLIADWIKAFPKDNGSVNLLNKLYKRIDFDGVSTNSKNLFNTFFNKYKQKIK